MAIEQMDLERAMDRLEARFTARFDRMETVVDELKGIVGRHDGILSSLLEKRRQVRAELGGESGENRRITMFHVIVFAAGAGLVYALFEVIGRIRP